MKKNVIGLIIIFFICFFLQSTAVEDMETQKKVAIEYFEKLTAGDLEAANELIAVPFNLDMRKVLKTKEEVISFHKLVLERKGKRAIPEYIVGHTRDELILDPITFPPYQAFLFEIMGTDKLYIYVSKTREPKVIGFAD